MRENYMTTERFKVRPKPVHLSEIKQRKYFSILYFLMLTHEIQTRHSLTNPSGIETSQKCRMNLKGPEMIHKKGAKKMNK